VTLHSTTVADIAAPNSRSIAIGPFGSALRAELYTAHGVPVVRGQDITDLAEVELSDPVYVSPATAAKFPACLLNEGDLVFPHRGAIGRVGLIRDTPMLLSSSMMKLTCDRSKVDPLFMLHYFRGPGKRELLMRASTVGTPGIGQPLTSLRGIPLDLPPLPEQRAIAEVLGALDDKIAANRRVADQSRKLAALMVSAVEPRVPLADLADVKRSTVNPTAFGNAPVLHFSLPACDVGVPERVADPSEIKSAKFELVDPCVLVSKLNPRIPRIWDVTALTDMRCFASTEFVVLHPTDGTTSVLSAALDDPRFSVALRGKVAGTSGSHQRVKPAELMATEVADVRTLPTETAESIGRLGELRASIVGENETLAATRDGLLPLLMSGKLRVKDAEKQVGEVV